MKRIISFIVLITLITCLALTAGISDRYVTSGPSASTPTDLTPASPENQGTSGEEQTPPFTPHNNPQTEEQETESGVTPPWMTTDTTDTEEEKKPSSPATTSGKTTPSTQTSISPRAQTGNQNITNRPSQQTKPDIQTGRETTIVMSGPPITNEAEQTEEVKHTDKAQEDGGTPNTQAETQAETQTETKTEEKTEAKPEKAASNPAPKKAASAKAFVFQLLDKDLNPISIEVDTSLIGQYGALIWVDELNTFISVKEK